MRVLRVLVILTSIRNPDGERSADLSEIVTALAIPEPQKTYLLDEIRNLADKHLEGLGYAIANYLVVLMTKLPAADPYQHLEEEGAELTR